MTSVEALQNEQLSDLTGGPTVASDIGSRWSRICYTSSKLGYDIYLPPEVVNGPLYKDEAAVYYNHCVHYNIILYSQDITLRF